MMPFVAYLWNDHYNLAVISFFAILEL